MDTINEKIEELLGEIRDSDIYYEYKKQEAILEQNPELKERVQIFRSNNYCTQNEARSESLLQVVEKLGAESAELRKIPEVNAFLDAELALCKLMQKVCRKLTEGIEMHIPEF
ncbi:MAG: YlbF family regulator [Blautia sp.]|nr:YlbF family regulator [Blautia sp.]